MSLALGLLDEAEVAAKYGLRTCPPTSYDQYENLNAAIASARDDAAAVQAAREAEDAAEAERARKQRTNYTHLLNEDVLVCIAEQGLAADPDMGLRMAGVCKAWRSAALSYPPLWRRLVLSRRRPMAKLSLFLERGKRPSDGHCLDEVIMRFPVDDERVARVLGLHMRNLERLTFDGFSFDQIVVFTDMWRGLCTKLTFLHVLNSGGVRPTVKRPLFFGLLDPNATSLRTASVPVGNTQVFGPQDVVPRYGSREWVPNTSQLANLKHLDLRNAELHLSLASLLALTPALEWLELAATGPHFELTEQTDLPSLKHLHLCSHRLLNLNHTSMPNLEWLSLHRSGAQVPLLNLGRFRHLTYLDVGFCYLGPEFATLLGQLPKLRFLGLAGCNVQNDLLEHLVVEEGKPVLVPELCALSLAGNGEISSAAVSRIVRSRNLGALKAKPEPKAPVAKSPFAPAGPFAPQRSKSQSSSRRSSQSKPPASAPPPPSTAAITFLVLDHCNGPFLDTGELEGLKRFVRFVSYANGTVIQDRIRGRGAFDWTKVMAGHKMNCHLRKFDESNGWYVHHTCKKAKTG